MSPASRSKSKDKKSGKEPPKGSSKTSGHANVTVGIPASGYNPVLGTFHTFDPAPLSSVGPLHVNGRFGNIDDTDDQSGSIGTGIEYDSVSNNGSWSGESEDHKEKPSHHPPRQESVPGADNDKREKIRQKNERKHQRQKERRAQELHERCNGYLMSRKLEALAQQLVAMGFSQERATMALILNEGRVEESVAWLFEGGEEDKQKENNLDSGGNLKIDISEELARIADMEIRYKASKQEVERAVVTCEGDLEKAEETLKAQKQEPPSTPPKPEETGDPPTVVNGEQPLAISQNVMRPLAKPTISTTIQQKKDDKDFNYTKVPVTAVSSADPGSKSMQMLKKIQPKMDWAKLQQIAMPAEKRWPNAGSNPSVSQSLAPPLQASPPAAKTESRYVAVGNDLKNLQIGSVREPVMVMQRPQSINVKQVPTTSVSSPPPGTAMGWYNGVETVKSNGLVPPFPGTRGSSPDGMSSNLLYNNQLNYLPHQQYLSSSGSVESQGTRQGNGLWSRSGTSPTLAAASSLGLFSGLGTNGLSGTSYPVDWNTGSSTLQLDYTNIDWSLDRGSSMSRPGGLWPSENAFRGNSTRAYDSFTSGRGNNTAVRPILSNGNGVFIPGLQDGVASTETTAGGSREWTSPFEERDIFSLPRQYVSSPSQ
ncbi:Ubiquitin-associated/translation elongation factor EF1B protein [Forsythia ovata]|uniref:Ubiquitin-associated/translation elongation factor EF1B protein n=1 Tax=Forsythia ovata TaxID=205694 RepID=A0ABD1X5N7_9LAMI